MINEKIEELRKVLPHDLRQATKKRNYSLGKGATHSYKNCVITQNKTITPDFYVYEIFLF